jgi:hypothetical protein
MRRYKAAAAAPDDMTSCGRPQNHNGDCRSRETCARNFAADARRRDPAKRRRQRQAARAAAYGREPVLRATAAEAGAPAKAGKPSGCGTYIAWLLHKDRGEEPCPACDQAAEERLAEQAERNRALLGAGLRERYRERRAAA